MDHAPARPRRVSGTVLAALAVAQVLAFTGGLLFATLVADGPAPRPARAPDRPAAEDLVHEEPPLPALAPPAAAPRPAPAAALAVAPALGPAGRPTAATVARVAEDAARSLEAVRPQLARCLPDGGRGAAPARLTFHVAFDATGREVARGVAEDRRARSPELARCLRALPLGAVSVAPPGAPVGVRVAITFP